MNTQRKSIPLSELITLSLLGAVTAAAQSVMSPLPNIEPVTLFLICFTLTYGLKALLPCYVFVLLEGLIFGFGLWFLSYLYIWAALILFVWLLRNIGSYALFTVVAAAFGLLFGALCALPYLIAGGVEMAFSYWIAGIPYDLLHGAGNAVLSALLLKPLTETLKHLKNRPPQA